MEVDWPSVGAAAVAAIIAGAAWWETRKARKASERSAQASERSAVAADRSAVTADRSADAAERSATEAANLTRIESGRRLDEVSERHEALAPPHPEEIVTTLESSAVNSLMSLYGTFSTSRDYYVHAEGWTGTSSTPVTVFPCHVDANKIYKFHIEHWPDDRTSPQTQEIRFQFWPPHPSRSAANAWTCPCNRPAVGAAGTLGHWEIRVPVKPPTIPRVSYIG